MAGCGALLEEAERGSMMEKCKKALSAKCKVQVATVLRVGSMMLRSAMFRQSSHRHAGEDAQEHLTYSNGTERCRTITDGLRIKRLGNMERPGGSFQYGKGIRS